jgi:surfeit locus 1 family protein
MRLRWDSAIVWIGACVAVLATARLGLWQLDRASEQTALAQEQSQRSVQPVLTAPQLARSAAEASTQWHRRVALSGRWLHRQAVFLDNRPWTAEQVFSSSHPCCSRRAALFSCSEDGAPRDPPGAHDHRNCRARTTASRCSRRSHRCRLGGSNCRGADEGPIQQNLDLATLGREIDVEFRPLSLLETQAPVPDDGLVRRWSVPVQAVWKHHGYAFQWFALSALIAGLTVWFLIVRPLRAKTS